MAVVTGIWEWKTVVSKTAWEEDGPRVSWLILLLVSFVAEGVGGVR